jgi:hypothetical protein
MRWLACFLLIVAWYFICWPDDLVYLLGKLGLK